MICFANSIGKYIFFLVWEATIIHKNSQERRITSKQVTLKSVKRFISSDQELRRVHVADTSACEQMLPW